jgi:hypothetical protein
MAITRFDSLVFPTGAPLAAADINSLTENARRIDQLSYRGRRAFTGAMIRWAYEYDQSPTVVMRGAFQFRTGVTNLNIIAEASFPSGTHTMRVYLNTVLRYSATWVTTRTNYFFAITSYGFADLDIVEVEVHHEWTGVDGSPVVIDAYVDAMSGGVSAYPTPTSFGAISEANLTALMTAQQWVWDRINRTDQVCFMGSMFAAGYGYDTANEMLLFDGSIEYSNGAGRLMIGIRYEVIANQAERIAVRIDGTQVATEDLAYGEGGEIAFDIDISGYTADTTLRLTIIQVVLTPPLDGVRELGSRFSITDIFTRRATYPAPTLPSLYSPRQSLTFTDLQTALNQIRTITNDAATRVGSALGAFNRQRVFRWQPGADDGQNAFFQKVLVAKGRRAHDALWVRGKGLTIGYGPIAIKAIPDQIYEWTPQYEETLIDGSAFQTRLVYFDQFPGLDFGMDYYIYGERIIYAAEQVRSDAT